MSNNLKVLLIGTGYMGKEYGKVLKSQGVDFCVSCRSEKSAEQYEKEMGVIALPGGIDLALANGVEKITHAIVAVSVEQLSYVTKKVVEAGVKNVLVEKPAGLNYKDIEDLNEMANKYGTQIAVAYNRRFYASTQKALEIIEQDGGVSSVSFEFTEWGYTIEDLDKPDSVKEEWLLANSSHVIDLAFFFAGEPKEMKSFCEGSLCWHHRASKYAGAGITDRGVLFSYHANWDAPGRWAVEVLTSTHRLYFKPMEKLSIQDKGSIEIREISLDDTIDIDFKPGLYKQVEAFLFNSGDTRLLSLNDYTNKLYIYKTIENIKK